MKSYFIYILLFLPMFSFAQIEEGQIILQSETEEATSVYSADIDGDGDLDVVSTSSNDNKVAWYKNEDGQGTFGMEQIISSNAIEAGFVHVADLDGDGDQDLLSASFGDGYVAWYRNEDGLGNFVEQELSFSFLNGVNTIYGADMDAVSYTHLTLPTICSV